MVTNFILAGRDTTGVSLAWFLYEVSCNPQVEEKIVAELLRLERDRQGMTDYTTSSEGEMSDFVRLLDYENVSNMHYLHAALSESMRLHGPIPVVSYFILRLFYSLDNSVNSFILLPSCRLSSPLLSILLTHRLLHSFIPFALTGLAASMRGLGPQAMAGTY